MVLLILFLQNSIASSLNTQTIACYRPLEITYSWINCLITSNFSENSLIEVQMLSLRTVFTSMPGNKPEATDLRDSSYA
jgi:hypothetical protein